MADRGAQRQIGERRVVSVGIGTLAWVIGLLWIFPFAWTLLTSFKSEQDAAAQTFHSGLSFGRYHDVAHSTTGTLSLQTAFTNSLVVVVVSTLIVLALALPAAYALAIRPIHKWRDVLFFFISTKFLPIVASIFPIYVYAEKWNLIGTRTVLIVFGPAPRISKAKTMSRWKRPGRSRKNTESSAIDT